MTRPQKTIITVVLLAVLFPVSVPHAMGQPTGEQPETEQIGERGLPFPSEHYAPPEYGQNPQNWTVVQDRRGMIYVANNDGVMQYDGERWRLIPTSTGTIVRSLAIDSLVYVGVKGDFGYLRPDSLGTLRYRSLYEHIPEGKRNFTDVWNTHGTSEGTYFQANERLFRWDGKDMMSWSSGEGFHTSFAVRDTLYVRDIGRGLLRMSDDSLTLVPRGEVFSDIPIYMMAPHPSGQILIATRDMGLHLYDGRDLHSFAPEVTSYLQENDLYHGTRLPGNRYALATLGGGVLIIESDGSVLRILDESTGLPDEVVNYVYSGRGGHLWMALNNDGVYRTDLSAPTTLFDERTGLEGTIRSIQRHEGSLFVATGRGLHVLQKNKNPDLGGGTAQFTLRDDLPLAWDLLSQDEALLAATQKGTYRITNGGTEHIAEDHPFVFSKVEEEVIYVGTRSGLRVLRRSQDGWESRTVKGTSEELRALATKSSEVVWASTIDGDVFRFQLSEDRRRVVSKAQFGTESGLPDGYNSPTIVDGNVVIRSTRGIFRVKNPDTAPPDWQFERHTTLLPETVEESSTAVRAFFEAEGGDLWVTLGNRVYRGTPVENEDGYKWRRLEALHFPKQDPVRFHLDGDETVWLGTGQQLIRYAPGTTENQAGPAEPFRAFIRRVVTVQPERILYGDYADAVRSESGLTVPYAGNDLRFEVAAPFYGTTDSHQYQYRLAGHSNGWSRWQNRARTTYTNLWEGTYRFQVRARSDRGDVSDPATLVVTVEAPWYRSIWAYLAYGIVLFLLGAGFRQYYRLKQKREYARKQERELKQEREAKRRLERANEQLREANRLKEEFLANTSHELRTPLTNILGFIEVLRETATDEQDEFLQAIENNGKRLKRTLRALLDLSRLRSETGEADLSPIPIADHVQSITSEFREAAEGKGLDLQVEVPEEPVYAQADERYLEQILRNLIENATKFTSEGHVAVSVSTTNEHVEIAVEDTGIGIEKDFIPQLFEDFKQESKGKGRSFEGYGLGLGISSRMANLMGADITVESTKGKGSTFTLRLSRCTADAETHTEPRPE